MTTVARQRILWKEIREFLPLFLAGCVAFVVTVAGTYSAWQGTEDLAVNGLTSKLFTPLNLFTNLCGIVTGVLLFAPEKENRTSRFLSHLPVSSLSVAKAKLRVGAVLLFAFLCFAYCCVVLAGQLNGEGFKNWPPVGELVVNLIVTIECFLWGLVWSLFLRSTLYALTFATLTVLFHELTANNLVSDEFGIEHQSLNHPVAAALVRLPLLAVGGLLLVKNLADWWHEDDSSTSVALLQRVLPSKKRQLTREKSTSTGKPRSVFVSLLWQSLRQSRGVLLVGGMICLLVGGVVHFFYNSQLFLLLLGLVGASILYVSSVTFSQDHQQGRYRFFQQHAEFGSQLWLARMTPVFGLVLLAVFCMSTGRPSMMWNYDLDYSSLLRYGGKNYASYATPNSNWICLNLTIVKVLLLFVTVMAVGQFFSMFISSPIVSVAAAFSFGLLLAFWSAVLLICNASLWLFLFPMALFCFVSSWRHTSHWLGQEGRSSSIFPWLLLLLVSFSVLGGFFWHRHVEVSSPDNVLVVSDYFRSDALKTNQPRRASPLEVALDDYRPIPGQQVNDLFTRVSEVSFVKKLESELLTEYVQSNRNVIEAIKNEVSQTPLTISLNTQSSDRRMRQRHQIYSLLLADTEWGLRNKELEQSFDTLMKLLEFEQRQLMEWAPSRAMTSLIAWSHAEGQTKQSIEKAIEAFQLRMDVALVGRTERRIAHRHANFENQLRAVVQGDPNLTSGYVDSSAARFFQLMPWEVSRNLHVGQRIIEYTKRWDAMIDRVQSLPRRCYSRPGALLDLHLDGSPYLRQARTNLVVPGFESSWLHLKTGLRDVQFYRYVLVRMALNAFHEENDSYPDSLEGLREILGEIPCDAYIGGDFVYSPNGCDRPVVWGARNAISQHSRELRVITRGVWIEAGQPFLLPWSSDGGQVARLVTLSDALEESTHLRNEEELECYDFSDPTGVASNGFHGIEFELKSEN